MIVKIWPIKADYASDKSKIGGTEGLKNAFEYITDAEKVIVNRDDLHAMDIVDTENPKESPDDFAFENNRRVLNYMANEDKIAGKYISGYLCNPAIALSQFNTARERTLQVLNRKDTKKTGAIAYHIVQSFPEGLSISDEEVHQCGLELCEKLNAYQGVVCSHVHPSIDEEGKVHGKSKHNHILINAYIHPDKLDPNRPEIAKYNDCNETYAQLRAWNDEIAIEHGLPIIRNPDDDRIYSWKESDTINQGLSWKQRVRVDIQEAKRASSSWDDFVQVMKDAGYKIKDGAHVSYTAPNGKTVRDNKLGRQYSKDSLQRYWKYHELNLKSIEAEDTSPPLLDYILSSENTLYASVPLGMKGQSIENYSYIPLENTTHSNDSIRTYFNEDEHYDICDEQHRSVYAATGREIIECIERLRDGKESYRKREDNKHEPPVIDFVEQRKKEKYYVNVFFVNTQTKKPYRTSLYDSYGRRRSTLELMLLLALVILKKESDLWDVKYVPEEKKNDPIFAPRSWKIQNMIDSIHTAQEENIETPAQMDLRLKEAGAAYSRARSALKSTTKARDKMQTLHTAVVNYRNTESFAREILDMQEGPEKDSLSEKYKDVLDTYKTSKAVLYRYQVTTEEQIADFEKRYDKIQHDIVDLDERLDLAKEEYRKLKKLNYNIELSQNAQYCYGPNYSYENVYQMEQEKASDEVKNKHADQSVDELISSSSWPSSEPQQEQFDLDAQQENKHK